MYFSLITFCLMAPRFLALPLNDTIPVNKAIERIIGGSDAPDGAYPYQVSLRTRQNFHFCGGSIIDSKWILTAAHCAYGQSPSNIIVVVGTNSLNSSGTAYDVTKIITHYFYNPQRLLNDIALLRIDGKINYGPNVQPIKLALTNPAPDSTCVLSGWGLTSYPATNPPNNLQHISLKAISLTQCMQALPGYLVFAGHVCTYVGPGRGACNGDSGGPLASGDRQVGVVSWGIPCAQGSPDVFTSVAFYRIWITVMTGIWNI